MRYTYVPTISFTDINGVTWSVKDMRERPAYLTRGTRKRVTTEPFDYIAQLPDVYGEDKEGLAFLLWEANFPIILDASFDLTKVQTITIPVPP
jgi:hypothetical protein